MFSYALQLRAASFLSGTISAAQEKPAHQNPKKNKLSTWRNLENPIIAKSCYQLGYISYRICYTVYHTGRRHFWTRQHTSATGGDRSHVSNIQNPCDTQLYWLIPRDPYIWLINNPYITTGWLESPYIQRITRPLCPELCFPLTNQLSIQRGDAIPAAGSESTCAFLLLFRIGLF